MREVQILSNPVAVPGVCGKCGSQNKDWFVDIGCDTEFNHKHETTGLDTWLDGVFYLCCDCFNSLIADATRRFAVYEQNHDVRVNLHGHSGIEQRTDFSYESSSRTEPDDQEPERSSEPGFVTPLTFGHGAT